MSQNDDSILEIKSTMRHKSMHGVVELILMVQFRSSTTWYLEATCMMENRATQIVLMSTYF